MCFGDDMTKMKLKQPVKKAKDGKKRKYFSEHMKPKPKAAKRDLFLPPRIAADYSANWKNLRMVLNLEKNSPEKKLSSLPIKEAQKVAQSAKKDTNEQTREGSGKALNWLNCQGTEVAGTKQSPNHSLEHKFDKRQINDVKWRKRKKVEDVEKKPTEADIWFDIDPNDIETAVGLKAANIVRRRSGETKTDAESTKRSMEQLLAKESACDGLTHAVAMDCEMVGVGPEGEESMLARVSIVNYFGKCVYDKYIKPTEKVTDYRTAVSGIRPADIKFGENFKTVQQEVAKILEGRILVGHAIHNDLQILLLDHPKRNTRDTQKYKPFRKIVKNGCPSLRVLCQEILNVKVQQGEHSSVQDAQAAMRLYTLVKKKWEAELKSSRGKTSSPRSPCKPKTKADLKLSRK